MTAVAVTFDPIWEEKYQAGHAQRYPWDAIVSFVYRNAPRDRPRSEVRVIEIGFGTASNLWFAAREGFQVAGVEGSVAAVERARQRFREEGLSGDLRVGDFTAPLPFPSASFDLAIDRGALTCCGFSATKRAVGELARVLRPGGRLFFNPYSREHTSAKSGRPGDDGLVKDIAQGTLVGAGSLCFYDENEVRHALSPDLWTIKRLDHLMIEDKSQTPPEVHAEWRAIVERKAS